MITIIDYKMGNIRSIINAFQYLGYKVNVSDDPRQIERADKLVLPGVGSFKQAMNNIKQLELYDTIEEKAEEKKCPILGICLGMQLLAKDSDEEGITEGLGFLDFKVRRFSNKEGYSIPHIGFNEVQLTKNSKMFDGIDNLSDFYFVHSYRIELKKSECISAITTYGDIFVSAFEKENLWGVQFHPEKSQSNGLKLLDNFAKW